MWTADPVDAILKADTSEDGGAVARSWRPLTETGWSTSDPGGFWAPSEIEWNLQQLYALPCMRQTKDHWSNFEFERPQANATLPAVSQNTAKRASANKVAKKKGKETELCGR